MCRSRTGRSLPNRGGHNGSRVGGGSGLDGLVADTSSTTGQRLSASARHAGLRHGRVGALSLGLVVHAGGSVFRMLLMATFTYLSFQAIRNINLFGLVAGAVLGWNVSEWIARLDGAAASDRGTGSTGLVAGLVALWAVGVVTDRYYALMGDNTHFGLRETAHVRACRRAICG